MTKDLATITTPRFQPHVRPTDVLRAWADRLGSSDAVHRRRGAGPYRRLDVDETEWQAFLNLCRETIDAADEWDDERDGPTIECGIARAVIR